MEILNLNLIPTGANPVVHVSQYDEGRVIRFNLFEGSSVYTLDGTETIECDVKKPDGNVVTLAVTNTSSTYVEVTTTLQMCACSGESLGDIKITKGAVIIATLNFILNCERSPLENGIQSDSGIHNLETQIADAVADQYDADSVIFDNTPTAGHGIGYAVTSDGLKSYIPKDVSDLDDVTTSSPTSGEALVWDGSKWTNGTPDEDLDDLGDVAITTPTAGEILEYDGAEWVNVPNPASTDNFGAPYDENTTYNVPSIVIYNNLLYKLNDGEDGTTGPWDPTKWTQTSLAELSGADIPIGTSSDPSTIAGAVGAIKTDSVTITANTVNGYSIAFQNGGKNDKLVGVNCGIDKSGGYATGWQVVGTIDKAPATSVYCPLWNVTQGGALGMCRIDTDGTINYYVTTAANIRLAINIVYTTS
jgi:hypothetical protein